MFPRKEILTAAQVVVQRVTASPEASARRQILLSIF